MSKFERLIEEYKKGILIPIKDHITPNCHPELHQKITELCEQAKIPLPSNMFIIEEAFGMPNALMASGRQLLLGENLLKTLDYNKSTPRISKELEAVIGHELGHSTRLGKDIGMLYGSMAAPLVLYGGYKLYEYAKHRQEKKGHGNIQQHIEISGKELEQSIDKKIATHPEKDASVPNEAGFVAGAKHFLAFIYFAHTAPNLV